MVCCVGCVVVVLVALRRARESARRARCLVNLKQIGLATHMYSADWRDMFPTIGGPRGQGGVESLQLLYPEYLTDPALFVCPDDKSATRWDGRGPLGAKHCSYGYDHAHRSTDPPGVAIVADYDQIESPEGLPTCHRYSSWSGIHVLFTNMHVVWTITRYVGHGPGGKGRDDIYTRSHTLPPEEDSWITGIEIHAARTAP